jgi:bifunctional oligoribonuclease and PAP phosphatase NrnA
MSTTKAPEALLQRVRQGNRFLLTSHVSPDGDAIGSELGLVRILRGLGKGAVVWNRDPTPALYRALPGAERLHVGAEPPAGFPEKFDTVIVLECPSLERTGLAAALTALPIVNVDHHLGNEHYGEVNWVDTAAPAVGEMVYRLAQGLKTPLEPDTAKVLFLTLVSDTGCFRFANATAAAFEAAASLVRDGAHPEHVAELLYESQPEAALRLLGRMLESLELHDSGRVALVWLTAEMFRQAGATPADSEGLIDHPRSIAGVQAVGLLRQLDEASYKVSLRSRGDVDVEKVARQHGGGGHRNAAGFVMAGGGAAVHDAVVSSLIEAAGGAAAATSPAAVPPAAAAHPGAAEPPASGGSTAG